MNKHWIYNEQSETWLTGTPDRGAGIFKFEDGWRGNITWGENHLQGIGPFADQSLAIAEAENELERLEIEIGY